MAFTQQRLGAKTEPQLQVEVLRTWLGRVLQGHQAKEYQPFRGEVVAGESGAHGVLGGVQLQSGARNDALTLASHALIRGLVTCHASDVQMQVASVTSDMWAGVI
jgi:hypothetical protein